MNPTASPFADIEHDAEALEQALFELFLTIQRDLMRREAAGRIFRDGAAWPSGCSQVQSLIVAPVISSCMSGVATLGPYLRAALNNDADLFAAACRRILDRVTAETGATVLPPSLLN